jgi:hypothetical protein
VAAAVDDDVDEDTGEVNEDGVVVNTEPGRSPHDGTRATSSTKKTSEAPPPALMIRMLSVKVTIPYGPTLSRRLNKPKYHCHHASVCCLSFLNIITAFE